ncbi:MAG TPA: hypothetical protein PLN40_01970 [Agitococcus sp.]|nr:hypothetical protein [Agitococcus sp.]HNE90711.1 hypothetical protein [Agitococcus sp.]
MKKQQITPKKSDKNSQSFRKIAMFSSVGLIFASLGLLIWVDSNNSENFAKSMQQSDKSTQQTNNYAPVTAQVPLANISMDSLNAEEKQLGTNLQKRYGSKLNHPYWRLQTIESLKRYLMEKYPNDWMARLKAMLKIFFPAEYDKLLASLDAMESYNDWMAQLKYSTTFSSQEEKLRAIWDKRIQLFGEDAKIIWQAQLKQEKVDATLQQLDKSNLPLNTKVDRYVQTLVDVYGKEAVDPEKSHPVQQMEGLLTLSSVQDELHSLAPEQRKQELHHLRKVMGLDDAAIKRWDELDAERAQRAEAGASYMQERAALVKQYEGETLKVHIQALQLRKFGAEEAQYIRNEEDGGFYRFQERQQIGIN